MSITRNGNVALSHLREPHRCVDFKGSHPQEGRIENHTKCQHSATSLGGLHTFICHFKYSSSSCKITLGNC